MDKEFQTILNLVGQATGQDINRYDPAFLRKTVEHRMSATSCQTVEAYLEYVRCHCKQPFARNDSGGGDELNALNESLNVCYSEFFRHPLTFAILAQLVIPHLIEEKRKNGSNVIRIWSAGCAAGQEAYSLAILFSDHIARQGNNLSLHIFATDISKSELEIARRGLFNYRSVQKVPLKFITECFNQHGENYEVIPTIRDRVDFSVYDLLDDQSTSPPAGIFGDFDIVMCSNLLFYYSPEARQSILNKVIQAVAPHGFFITGEAEKSIVEPVHGFINVNPSTLLFQRTNRTR